MQRVWIASKRKIKKEKWIKIPPKKDESVTDMVNRLLDTFEEEKKKMEIEKLIRKHKDGLTTQEIAEKMNLNTLFLLKVLPELVNEGRIKRVLKH
ncbi:MAG: hypothetical protein ACE5J7_03675 [Candidatus Aenigmatarchaeota archaeon]